MEQVVIVSSVLLWVLVLFNLVLTLALVRRVNHRLPRMPDFDDIPVLEVGTQAPDFTAETLDNRTMTLGNYARQDVAFLFISPTCSPCIEVIPVLNNLGPQARRNGVELVLVSQADRTETQAFVYEHSIELPILVAPQENSSFFDDYKVAGAPFYCLVDGGGKVQSTGFLGEKWEQLIQNWAINP